MVRWDVVRRRIMREFQKSYFNRNTVRTTRGFDARVRQGVQVVEESTTHWRKYERTRATLEDVAMKSLCGARNGDLFHLQGSGESRKFLLFHIVALSRNEGFEILVAIVLTQTDCVRVHRRRS